MGLLPYLSNIEGRVPSVNQLEKALLNLGYNIKDAKLYGLKVTGGTKTVQLLLGGGTPTEGHDRLHAVDSALDHAAATSGNRNKLVASNPATGAIEFIDKPAGELIDGGTFKGTCNLLTDPGTPGSDEYWVATETGTYTNFGDLEVATLVGQVNYLKWDNDTSTWILQTAPVNSFIPGVAGNILDLVMNESFQLEVFRIAPQK